MRGATCGRCGEGATCRERRPGSCTEGGEICKLLLPHGCSIRSIHIEMRPGPPRANWGSGAGRACQPWGRSPGPEARRGRWREPSYASRLGAAVPRTLALQLGESRRERTRTDGFRRGARIDAAAPRRCAPAALLSICRCSHLPVNKSILQFNAAASRPPGTDAAAEPPPPSSLPSGGASG